MVLRSGWPEHRRVLRAGLTRRQALFAVGAATLSGCASPSPPIRVGSIVFPGYELMFAARDQRLLSEQQVRLVEMSASTDTIRCLAVGQLEAANLTLDEVLSARVDGVDLRVVAVLDVSAGADVVLSRPEITGLEQLRGKRIGVEEGATGALMLGALLEAAQLKVEEVRKVPMLLGRSAETYASGRVDVVVTAEPWARTLEAQGAHRLFDSQSMPNQIVDVLVATSDAVRRRSAALRHLISTHLATLEQWHQQPSQLAQLMAARLQLEPALVPAAFRGLELPDLARNRAMLGTAGSLRPAVRHLQQIMLMQGLLRQPQELDDLLDPSCLPV